MCELTFSPSDIGDWARISGDYNRIHFDPTEARRLGIDGVIAHGMLVLLAVKSRVGLALPSDGGWWLARARMRQPVVAGETVLLDTRPHGDGVAFSLTSQASRKLLIGSFSHLAAAPDGVARGQRYHLAQAAVAARLDEMNDAFPWLQEPWVAADALVFTEFLRRGAKDLLALHGIDLSQAAERLSNGTVVVQTTHNVIFDRDFLGGANIRAAGFDIDVLPPQAEAVEGGVSVTCQLVGLCDDRVVMLTSLSLFIRQDPQGSSHKE
jgi:MaoC like domain